MAFPAADVAMPVVVERTPAARPNWAAIGVVALIHVALFYALIQLNVIPIGKPKPAPTVVTLIPLEVAPVPEEAPAPPKSVAPPIVVPEAIVVPVAPPPPVTVTTALPPPQAIAAAPTPAPVVNAAAPVVPPDASAASLKNPSPRYPLESRRKREEGLVRMRVVITPEGRVKDIAVARSSGFERLDKAALEAVRRWKFVPGLQAGRPIEAIGFLNIPFKLSA